MNVFEKILHFLEFEIERPQIFGWFHIMCVAILVVACVYACVKLRDCSEGTYRKIVIVCWACMLVLEIYKQLVLAMEINEYRIVTWEYQWYAFPFQLCSTPIFVMPFVAIMKDGAVRKSLIWFLCFFSVFGGLTVIAYPNEVFASTLGINIQTMVHHGMQIFIGVLSVARFRSEFSIKSYFKSIPVFAVLVVMATVLNEIMYAVLSTEGAEVMFNMFYISRHFGCTLPLLSMVYSAVPYVAFVLIYIVGFLICAFAIFLIQRGILALATGLKARYAKK